MEMNPNNNLFRAIVNAKEGDRIDLNFAIDINGTMSDDRFEELLFAFDNCCSEFEGLLHVSYVKVNVPDSKAGDKTFKVTYVTAQNEEVFVGTGYSIPNIDDMVSESELAVFTVFMASATSRMAFGYPNSFEN